MGAHLPGGTGARPGLHTHPTPPCAATLCGVLSHLDRAQVEATLGAWAEQVLASLPAAPAEDEAVALDGKTLRGSRRQGALDVHLLSALSHRLGLTLGQHPVDDKNNEITVAVPLLRALTLKGRVFTMDALLAQRAIAEAIVQASGDYVMVVKDNQPQLLADVQAVFSDPPPGDRQATACSLDSRHGRVERRRLTASSALVGYSNWPGLRQAFRLERTTILKKTGETRGEVVYGVTSLDSGRADAQRLLRLARQHWRIENHSHWVRDVTFGEDHSQVRRGSTPEVMAALRNAAIGMLRALGATDIAAGCRQLAAQPASALALLGIATDN
jgi:predicted transposase YbfD/YdcC